MFSTMAESLIKKYCGKFLKNFSQENITISVTGTIKLTNIEFDTNELARFQLPYKPVRAFAGEIIADLPFVLGGNFDISVKNCIVVLEKDYNSDVTLDPSKVNAMLQSLIAVFYFSYINPETNQSKTLSGADLENSQRMFDRFFVTLENVHIRIEEPFKSHITTANQSELMCSGIVVDRLEIRPVTPAEKAASPHLYLTTNPKTSLVVNKIVKCIKMSVYCKREDSFCSNQKHDLTLGQVCNFHYHREGGNILEPLSFTLSVSGGFQKATQVFGPIVVDLHSEAIELNVTDEQTFYVHNLVHSIVDHMYRLQSNAWVAFAKSPPLLGADRNKRLARLRWDMIRKSIKVDWQKYTNKLQEGSMKWRAWFEMWRLAGRYVALREILMYHVGYESFTDAATGMVSYAIRENLIMNYSQQQGASVDQRDEGAVYVGKGYISEHVLKAAESLIYKQIIASNSYFMLVHNAQHTKQSVAINPFDLSTIALRALYALQIDLDAQLPFKVSAFCRIYAEDKYKLRQLQRKQAGLSTEQACNLSGSDPSGVEDTGLSTASMVTKERLRCTLLVSALDATNLKPSFGASCVNAYTTLQTGSWQSGGAIVTTETKVSKANSATNAAFALWGNVCSLSVDPSQITHLLGDQGSLVESSSISALNSHITVECFDRGLFSICYGTSDLQLSTILPISRPSDTTSHSEFTFDIMTHNVKLTRSSNLFGAAGSSSSSAEDKDCAVVRLVSMLVVGGEETTKAASNRFQEKIEEMIGERKTVLERQEKLAANESFANSLTSSGKTSAEGEEEEGESFILDPSMLTVQDIQLTVSLPSVSLQVFAVYVVPSSARDNDADDLPTEANVPLLRISLKGVHTKASASNNPWVLRGTGSMDQLQVQVLQTDPALAVESLVNRPSTPKDALPEPLLTLPRVTGTYSATQISTMGRSIDGLLDMSCFDFNCSVSMYPFTMTVNPQALFSSGASRGVNVWRAVRSLDHLWLKPAKWAKGMSSAHIGVDGKPPCRLKPEAAIRLGDLYTAHPRHLNVVTEVWGTVTNPATASSKDSSALLPRQQTRVKCLTAIRSLDVDVHLQPSVRSLMGESLQDVILANTIASANIKPYEAPTNIFNSWFGTAAPVEPVHTSTTASIPQGIDAAGWAVERKKLMDRIHELEERNRALSIGKK